jgi:ubiquinone biosynthesis protein Coq4
MNLSFLQRIKCVVLALYYGMRWAWNPLDTMSAIKAVELYFSQKISFPKIKTLLQDKNSVFNSKEFCDDMQTPYDLTKIQEQYLPGTLGFEYAKFMNELGFSPLKVDIPSTLPSHLANQLRLGFANHDMYHLLYGLYEVKNNKPNIQVFHEWVFLAITINQSLENPLVAKFLLYPGFIKSFLTFDLSNYNRAKSIGKTLAQSPTDLNHTWLRPLFDKPIEQVRQELGIKTIPQALQTI